MRFHRLPCALVPALPPSRLPAHSLPAHTYHHFSHLLPAHTTCCCLLPARTGHAACGRTPHTAFLTTRTTHTVHLAFRAARSHTPHRCLPHLDTTHSSFPHTCTPALVGPLAAQRHHLPATAATTFACYHLPLTKEEEVVHLHLLHLPRTATIASRREAGFPHLACSTAPPSFPLLPNTFCHGLARHYTAQPIICAYRTGARRAYFCLPAHLAYMPPHLPRTRLLPILLRRSPHHISRLSRAAPAHLQRAHIPTT